MNTFKTACPLDCWDQCALLVREDQGRVISIEPDSSQKVTGNLICKKGRMHLERLYHPERLLYPLLKQDGLFNVISWPEAVKLITGKISGAIEKDGPLSLLHFYDGGYGGLLKNIESRFFSALGGCTTGEGNLCWGAGLRAQKYDFGASVGHPYEDLSNARLVIIWGRNPAHTSLHLLPHIRQARKKGTRVILIDPLRTATAEIVDEHISIKPGSDGALALAMAREMIVNGWIDRRFIKQSCSGYEHFAAMCADYTPQVAASLTGLTDVEIERLAYCYAEHKPTAILIGIGLQRHSNGGSTVRAIDALAALSGNIGVAGGGATYANFQISPQVDHAYLEGEDLGPQKRSFTKPQLAAALEELQNPPVNFLYISRANPLVQVGDSGRLRRAMAAVPFIVTSEHFMTDTAAASDLVLPAAAFLEAEDLFFNSMSHQYLVYGSRVVAPAGECRPEYDLFRELAVRLGLSGFPDLEPDQLLSKLIEPLTKKTGITLDQIKRETPLLLPVNTAIPWVDGRFKTADGKYNFYAAGAEKEGGDALPCYREPLELGDQSMRDRGFRYWFATPHARETIHSTHRLPSYAETPQAFLHPLTAEAEDLSEGERIKVVSKRGSIEVVVKITDRVPPDTVMVYQGWWHCSGAAVNNLTSDRTTDIGKQAAYYDCLCRIDRLHG